MQVIDRAYPKPNIIAQDITPSPAKTQTQPQADSEAADEDAYDDDEYEDAYDDEEYGEDDEYGY